MAAVDRDELIDTKAAAVMLGCDPRTLKVTRMKSYSGEPGPEWTRVLGAVRYKRGAILDYIDARRGAPRKQRRPKRIPSAPPQQGAAP